jgi:7-keto-8-aminopelargonate synthetase-like enzyme
MPDAAEIIAESAPARIIWHMPRQPEDDLHSIDTAGLRRRLRVLDSAQGPRMEQAGRTLHNFSSNDYLGLASHPALIEAAAVAAGRFGFGSGASRLICGTMRPHAELEEHLAGFKHAEAALVFGSGFAAGSGSIPAIAGKDDIVILDKLAHACLIDGARASGATLRVFGHNRVDQLEDILKSTRARHPDARILVVTEAVFSMDGDLAPLADIVALKDAMARCCCSMKPMPPACSGPAAGASPPALACHHGSTCTWGHCRKRSVAMAGSLPGRAT